MNQTTENGHPHPEGNGVPRHGQHRRHQNRNGDVEHLSNLVVGDARVRGYNDPCVVLERIERASWEAYLGDHDQDLGVAKGRTAYEALVALLARIRRLPRVSTL